MTEPQILSIKPGSSLYVFTPLGLIRIEMQSSRKLKFFMPAGMQAFRPDKLDRMRQELTLVGPWTVNDRSGLIPTFRFLVPMVDKDGFIVGVASADDATFVLSEEPTLPQPETETDDPHIHEDIQHCSLGERCLEEKTNVPTQT